MRPSPYAVPLRDADPRPLPERRRLPSGRRRHRHAPGRNAAAVVLRDLGLRKGLGVERLRSQAALLRDAAPRGPVAAEELSRHESRNGRRGAALTELAFTSCLIFLPATRAPRCSGPPSRLASRRRLPVAPRLGPEVAAECSAPTPGRPVTLLGGADQVLGLAEQAGAPLELNCRAGPQDWSHGAPGSIAAIVRKEWFFYRVWAEPARGRDRRPRADPALAGPGSLRTHLAPSRSYFLRALDDLASRFGAGLPELAGLERGGSLLDVGGGTGSHAAYLEARRHPGSSRRRCAGSFAEVEQVLRERHPELRVRGRGLRAAAASAGTADESWDYVLLANILHDHPPERCRELIAARRRPAGAGRDAADLRLGAR